MTDEKKTLHTFKSLRHFPGLAKSITAVRTLYDESRPLDAKKLQKERPKTQISTHKLLELTHSAFSEVNAMRNVKSMLIQERAKQRITEAANRPKMLEPLLTPLDSVMSCFSFSFFFISVIKSHQTF